jgi:predicted O-methyltransferase YrrM
MENILKKIIEVTNQELDAIDLSEYRLRREQTNVPEHWFLLESGKEHYRLLCYISSLFSGKTFIDIGTWVGDSALALANNKENNVISFDIVRQPKNTQGIHINIDELIKDENIKFLLGDATKYNKEEILNSPFIMLDTAHDGIFENEFYNFLHEINYKGFFFLDDIHLNEPMKQFWNNITKDKYDLTKVGHWSGSGLVHFK